MLAVGFYWQAVVAFEGGRVSILKASVGFVIWAALWFMPILHESITVRTCVLGFLVAGRNWLDHRANQRIQRQRDQAAAMATG